jgi:cytochrome c oxidase cbb3-type subunit 3
MTGFWSGYIILIVTINIVGCAALLVWTRKKKADDYSGKEAKVLGHTFDGIQELDNPLPRWWLLMFWLTIAFAIGYLVLYPGYGSFKGVLGWTSTGAYQSEMKRSEQKYQPIFDQYAKVPVEQLIKDSKAMGIGQRLFANNCAVCHGSDGGGNRGFPNLTDNDWLYGGTPADITTSITNGRSGMMPAWGPILGAKGVEEVAKYVANISRHSLTGKDVDEGKKIFQTNCVACHGPDAKGNQMIGAPNLSDKIWLYGGTFDDLKQTITHGRQGKMPTHKGRISADKIHILAAYVYGLSHK